MLPVVKIFWEAEQFVAHRLLAHQLEYRSLTSVIFQVAETQGNRQNRVPNI